MALRGRGEMWRCGEGLEEGLGGAAGRSMPIAGAFLAKVRLPREHESRGSAAAGRQHRPARPAPACPSKRPRHAPRIAPFWPFLTSPPAVSARESNDIARLSTPYSTPPPHTMLLASRSAFRGLASASRVYSRAMATTASPAADNFVR